MDLNEFETLVRRAIQDVPKRFLDRMDNVAFVVEPSHRPAINSEIKILRGGKLLGLYQGVPYGKRGPWYSGVLPDKITLFQDTIEEVAGGDPARIEKTVIATVEHEIAHYFGMNEAEVRKWERSRKK